MYAVSLNTVKSHQLCTRMCTKGCCRVQKLPSGGSPMDKIPRRKNWWKTGVQHVFGKYLLLTNTISSGVLMAVGDLIQQELEFVKFGKHENNFDWKRNSKLIMRFDDNKLVKKEGKTVLPPAEGSCRNLLQACSRFLHQLFVNMGIVGTLQGPLAHFFYKILDKYFPGVKITTIIKKIFLDQALASPICIIIFFGGANFLEKGNFEDTRAELKEKFWVVYAVDCSVWIPAQFFNFYCFSTAYRVIYINLLTMCYNVFLSFMKHNDSF